MSVIDPTTRTFRDRMRLKWCPPWLARALGFADKYMYSFAVHADMLGEALTAGVKLRFPGLYSPESLPLIGRERRIARGPAESDASYAPRLLRWLDDHRARGGPYAMLAQIYAYYAASGSFVVELVYRNGKRFAMDTAGAVVEDLVAFSVDAEPERWARWWLFYYLPPGVDVTALTDAEVASYRLVPREWNAAHCIGSLMLVGDGGELWNYPDGHVWNESGTWNTTDNFTTLAID